jgi:hypothetical protein
VDAKRFDTWTRRRLSLTAGGLAALLVSIGGSHIADAKKKHKKKKRCKCAQCQICKKGKCKGSQPDGTACGDGKSCRSGQCVAVCDPSCEEPATCINGTCKCTGSGALCGESFCCPHALSCQDDACFCDEQVCSCAKDAILCATPTLDQCCLPGDTCDEFLACETDTCAAGNAFCTVGWAVCGGSGSCGCFATIEGDHVCADAVTDDLCPDSGSECASDAECPSGEVCVDVTCCDPQASSIGACRPLCPVLRERSADRSRSAALRKRVFLNRRS